MNPNTSISDIMTRNLVSVQEDASLYDVIALVRKHHIRHIPVLKGKQITGIISSNDINRLTFGGLFNNQEGIDDSIINMMTVPQVMTVHPTVVQSNQTIKEVASILAKGDYHSLPVEEGGKCVGIVTTTDLLKYMVSEFEEVPV